MTGTPSISQDRALVATIHFSPFTGEWFTDFLFAHGFFLQQEGSFCPFSYPLGNHGRMFRSFTPFTANLFIPSTRIVATKDGADPLNLGVLGPFHHIFPRIGNSQGGGGGKMYRAILGGETYCRVSPPKPGLEASENGIGLVCARFL